jgi:hypothetical protein
MKKYSYNVNKTRCDLIFNSHLFSHNTKSVMPLWRQYPINQTPIILLPSTRTITELNFLMTWKTCPSII